MISENLSLNPEEAARKKIWNQLELFSHFFTSLIYSRIYISAHGMEHNNKAKAKVLHSQVTASSSGRSLSRVDDRQKKIHVIFPLCEIVRTFNSSARAQQPGN